MHVKPAQRKEVFIDLRSDTVTRPTEAMLDAMRDASLEDDARDGDSTVQNLEKTAAECMGKEAALFMPSGTMTNLVAVLAHTSRGGEVLLESGAHILNSELGGLCTLAGVFYRGIPGRRGAMDPALLSELIRPLTRSNLGTALVCMETTHNKAGGSVLPLDHMKTIRGIAAERGIPVHTDGARVFNASIALGVSAAAIAEHTDSISFCVSKGLSAPVGSLLCGSAAFIDRARAFRRMVGGNMRQAGPLAAAALIAVDTMVQRLRDDHATAKQLAVKLHAVDSRLVDPVHVQTNIVRVELPTDGVPAAEWAAALGKRAVLVSPSGRYTLRFVTHRHIDESHIDAAASAFRDVWRTLNQAH
jgi:threonine aldolase